LLRCTQWFQLLFVVGGLCVLMPNSLVSSGRGTGIAPNKKDMDALLKRAEECELAATRSNDPADQAANLWFATKYREKAAALAQASRPGRLGAV
jgi:hypothetical protein